MAAKRKTSKQNSKPLPSQLSWLFEGQTRTGTLIALIVVAVLIAWYAAWHKIGDEVLASEQYWLTCENVELMPPADFIRRDIRREVFRDASLDGPLSILDDGLTERIANAFELHAWVASVVRVTKHHPAKVTVQLEYRRPVCMVVSDWQLYPVDVEGVLLPHEDFSPLEARAYPQLDGVDSLPIGPVGTRWGDAGVLGGAEIVAACGTAWTELGLDRIVASPLADIGYGDEHSYDLFTKAGSQIHWGRPPSTKRPNEAPAADKIARLRLYVAENGTLEGPNGPQYFDVSDRPSAPQGPRTAARPPQAQPSRLRGY